jgi:hypothetical protein
MSHQAFHVAAAGLLVGLESQVPGIYQRNLPPLKTHYGFTDREVEFFAIHIEADEVHGERGYQIVERHCTTPERQAEAVEAVRQATEMRWQYMTGPLPRLRREGGAVSRRRSPVWRTCRPVSPPWSRSRARAWCWPGSTTTSSRCSDECAHQGGPLSEGQPGRHATDLPWHGWMFDMKSGTCLMPSRGGPVTSYPVTIEAGEVWVEVP